MILIPHSPPPTPVRPNTVSNNVRLRGIAEINPKTGIAGNQVALDDIVAGLDKGAAKPMDSDTTMPVGHCKGACRVYPDVVVDNLVPTGCPIKRPGNVDTHTKPFDDQTSNNILAFPCLYQGEQRRSKVA